MLGSGAVYPMGGGVQGHGSLDLTQNPQRSFRPGSLAFYRPSGGAGHATERGGRGSEAGRGHAPCRKTPRPSVYPAARPRRRGYLNIDASGQGRGVSM
jgi:hypothetical protein